MKQAPLWFEPKSSDCTVVLLSSSCLPGTLKERFYHPESPFTPWYLVLLGVLIPVHTSRELQVGRKIYLSHCTSLLFHFWRSRFKSSWAAETSGFPLCSKPTWDRRTEMWDPICYDGLFIVMAELHLVCYGSVLRYPWRRRASSCGTWEKNINVCNMKKASFINRDNVKPRKRGDQYPWLCEIKPFLILKNLKRKH